LVDRPRTFALGAVVSGALWYVLTMVPLVPVRPYCEAIRGNSHFPRNEWHQARLPAEPMTPAAVRAFAGRFGVDRKGPYRIVERDHGPVLLVTWDGSFSLIPQRLYKMWGPVRDGQVALTLIPPSIQAAGTVQGTFYPVWTWSEDPAFTNETCQVMVSLLYQGEIFPGDWETTEEIGRVRAALARTGISGPPAWPRTPNRPAVIPGFGENRMEPHRRGRDVNP
jgi:hypothetical protein